MTVYSQHKSDNRYESSQKLIRRSNSEMKRRPNAPSSSSSSATASSIMTKKLNTNKDPSRGGALERIVNGGNSRRKRDSNSKQEEDHPHRRHVDSNSGLFPGFHACFDLFNRPERKKKLKRSDDDFSDDDDVNGVVVGTEEEQNDVYNYALLVALYTLQGIPMGLSASIPFLIQQKVKVMAEAVAATTATGAAETAGAMAVNAAHHHPSVAKMAYNAQAIFALCSWPFSLKLLWAPIVDAVFSKRFGRRKSWLVPVQGLAGVIMISGSGYVERQLGLGNGADGMASTSTNAAGSFNVKGVTAFFFALYFLMATQDIAVDGWALTMLSKKNRGRGPVCNSIGQNFGYFLSFVGFLAFNDADSSENLWRPLLGLKSRPGEGVVSLGGFIRFMGFFMLAVTTFVALFKREEGVIDDSASKSAMSDGVIQVSSSKDLDDDDEDDDELDASKIGLAETYHRLWAVCQLPSVRMLFLILLTYRLPTALSDNVKFLKAVEFGLSKQTTALLSPMIVLPLGIAVPIYASKVWKGHPLKQFLTAYKFRVTLVALFDVMMLLAVRSLRSKHDATSQAIFWSTIVGSTTLQAIMQSLQFNAQMTFFASRVDPAIGGSYMTLLNTAANLGGTWPASAVMYLVGQLTVPPECSLDGNGVEVCTGGRDAYFPIQIAFSILGCLWIFFMGKSVNHVANLPEEAWLTHIADDDDTDGKSTGATAGAKKQSVTKRLDSAVEIESGSAKNDKNKNKSL